MMKSLGKQMRNENMTFAQFPLEPNLTNRTEEMRREIGNKHASECNIGGFYSVNRKMGALLTESYTNDLVETATA